MKLSHFRPALYALICSAGFLHADIVTLKDGKKLEGNILSETPAAIRMRYKLTPKIWDEKDIPRTEIAEVIKQKPEEVEVIDLRKLLPTPDLMTAEKYEALIQDRLRPFVNRYPGTKEAAEVEKMIATAQEEKEKVVSGGMKVEGKWLTPDEAKADSYNIKAYGVYAEILEKVEAKDYGAALRAFDKMANSQSGYVASIYYPKAVEAVNEVLVKYEGQIEQMIKDQPALQRLRDEGIKKLVEPDLSRMKDAILRENEQWKDGYEAERKSTRWFTPYKYDLSSLKNLAKTITAEKARLKEIDTVVIGKINQAIADIMRSEASAGKDGEALKKMGEAILAGEAAAGGADAGSRQFYSTVFQGYRQRYAYAQQQLAAKSMQQTQTGSVPGAVGGSTAVAGTGTPGMDDRVAAALAAASGGAAPATQAPAAGAVPAVAPGTGPAPTPGVVVPGAQPVVQPAVAAPTGAASAAPSYAQPQQAAPMSIQPPVEESAGISTNTLILIGIGVVVLVLVVAMSGGKKKK
jgi:hypothetical protein